MDLVKLLKQKLVTGGGHDNNLLYSGIPHTKIPSSKIIDKIVKLAEEKQEIKLKYGTHKSREYYS